MSAMNGEWMAAVAKGRANQARSPQPGPAPALQCIDFGGTPPSNHLPGADEKDQ